MRKPKKNFFSVLGGIYKRRSIYCPEGVRPLTGICKKSMFDIISPRILKSHFLDLFAGAGSVGIEAISRGAEFAVFVEKDRLVCGRLANNLKKLGIPETKYKVLNYDVNLFLRGDREEFDIVFAGPPYKLEIPPEFYFFAMGFVKKGGIFIFQRSSSVGSFFSAVPSREKSFCGTTLEYYEKHEDAG
ncbi:MAG: RsmD family RNA methyltransferase [Elusimicrobia bacterium]|nr:RsmD family RNA methyltransferase [Elusimicrobiota bacterium]